MLPIKTNNILLPNRIHFIAIGGSAMHSLALDLAGKNHKITGSDDQFYEPSKSRLQQAGLLPKLEGWSEENITPDIELIVLGMHAKENNPEVVKAQKLGIPIISYPELIYRMSADKQRIVIAGSHGKTTITSMIAHVLKTVGKKFDFVIGAAPEGEKSGVKITADAPVIIIEGDEYLSSALDPKPKFLNYHHHIGVVSGIAWDHINVFPTLNTYVRQFDHFADNTPKGGILIFNEEDDLTSVVCKKEREDVTQVPYQAGKFKVRNGQYFIQWDGGETPLQVIGKHNMQNIAATFAVCECLRVPEKDFFNAISTFTGAKGRLQKLENGSDKTIIKDFAHAPSKVQATVAAVKEAYAGKKILAVLEIHTFSSLNKDYILNYKNSLSGLESSILIRDPEVIARKGMGELTDDYLKKAFNEPGLAVVSTLEELKNEIDKQKNNADVILMMSSGNFLGLDLQASLS